VRGISAETKREGSMDMLIIKKLY
ncbi:uncharacterized protein METZ01_LOCUS126336, partial [marine metagenome]